MKPNIEDALALCGREHVFHREHAEQASVAINLSGFVLAPEPQEQRMMVAHAATLDEAGEAAARQYVERLRRAAKNISDQADRIERTLASTKP